MKRVPIFKLSTSTLFQQDYKLEVLTNGIVSTPTIVSSNLAPGGTPTKSPQPQTLSNNNNNNNIDINTSTTTTTTTNNSNDTTSFNHLCTTCIVSFTDRELRNAHYKSGVHRYNLNLRVSHMAPVSEEEYNTLLNTIKQWHKQDVLNKNNSPEEAENSGSESEDDSFGSSSDDSSDEEYLLRKNNVSENPDLYDEEYYYKTQGYQFYDNNVEMNDPKVKIIQKDLKLQISVWRCLLGPSSMFKNLSQAQDQSIQQKQLLDQIISNFKKYVLSKDLKWVVLLCSGGRFAGAVYSAGKCIDHKTFHRYTMRKKQGGAQSTKDNQSGNKKSAGAGMRRYNEKRLKEEVFELMESWKQHFKECSHIFVFAPKGNTRDILFPPQSFLSVEDERIRTIPFPIIRPTFSEAQRVSTWISSADIELFDEEKLQLEKEEQEKRQKERQERLEQEQKLKEKEKRRKEYQNKNEKELDEQRELEEKSSYDNDRLFVACRERDLAKVKYLIEQDSSYEIPVPNEEKKELLIAPVFIAIDNSDIKMASYLLDQFPSDINLLNPRWDYVTCLHRAASKGNCQMIELLLNKGADPTVVGGLHPETPYDSSSDQKTRDTFREWAGDHLDKWDYTRAHIVPLTKQMKQEKDEKKKQKRKQQREKEKTKKQHGREEKEKQTEQDKLKSEKLDEINLVDQLQRSKISKESQLSSRERRALAAEQRTSGANLKNCDFCNLFILGIPFERLNYKYCSTLCCLNHKKKLESNK
ncbi:hypothetical protein DICPUDRAFT_79406 [Dictyostelium purpureum]|uniref:VLRF1 domain-containing protein n=1 Tax=Dictyostelium purpureum TaxID=5786 RepID=F0ZMH7_DICPU|nr:uncharacterized protein DICPUDRAFT_79406 [Dictyostelium purpureum]EGC34854.1 hypothetical protein DICPUDRAFT_79406 [Dictyostelium purpureum]|eukprot:XP_003288608.1 hypothetical protein DICPUDRAFT_79406 [Dictyostelium purpureum]